MSSNQAAWLVAEKVDPFKVDTAPMPTPGDNQIVVRNHAVGVAPFDGILQKALSPFPMTYPAILGHDVAGTVEAVGPNVTRFKKGDRVIGHGMGVATSTPAEAAFQNFTLLRTNIASELPDTISFEAGAVVPLGASTAACALFQDDLLKLQLPTEPRQKPTGQALLIWGGSTSVGSNAIQLAVAAGYEVVATASPRNFDYVKKLGASQVFDYSSSTVVQDILAALQGKTVAGAFACVMGSSWTPTFDILRQSTGNKTMISAGPGWPEPPEGVTAKFVFGASLKDNNVGKAIYEDYLPKALKSGAFVPAPEPLVGGKGLQGIQEAVHLQSQGTSAKKVIVTL